MLIDSIFQVAMPEIEGLVGRTAVQAKNILSLGGGVQSSALFLMSCAGVVPKLDAAVFADAGWEPQSVYNTIDWLRAEGRKAGIPILRVSRGSLRKEVLRKKKNGTSWTTMPLFVKNSDKSRGMIARQCTREFKIRPINRYIRNEILGYKPRQKVPEDSVRLWIGISFDEALRIKQSDVKWRKHVFPLCNFPDLFFPSPLTRRDCSNWLREKFPDRSFVRSACIGCPYRSDEEWRFLHRNFPNEWKDAVDFDESIRRIEGMRGQCFLHPSLIPLKEIPEVKWLGGQGEDRWGNECSGVCGT